MNEQKKNNQISTVVLATVTDEDQVLLFAEIVEPLHSLALVNDAGIRLRKWFSEKDWHKWDQQIEADSKSGKLDFLLHEALEAKSKNKLRTL